MADMAIFAGRAKARSHRRGLRMLYMLSPAGLMIVAWLLTFVGTAIGLLGLDHFPTVARAIRDHDIDVRLDMIPMAWLVICLVVFLAVSGASLRPISANALSPPSSGLLSRPLRVALTLHMLFTLVNLAWVGIAVRQIGGLGQVLAMLGSFEVYVVRDVFLDNTLFKGMRLIFSGLVPLGVFGAAVVAHNIRSGERNRADMRIGWYLFLMSLFLLASLSVILSQRLLSVHLMFSAGIAAAIVLGRVFFMRYLPIVILVLFVVWSAREWVTVGIWNPDASPFRLGFERILFYFINDFYNSLEPITQDLPHTWGYYTFRFATFVTLTDDYFKNVLAEELELLSAFRGGGNFPIFATPFVDFSYAGLLIVALIAALAGFLFNRAQSSLTYACIYGQLGAALAFSTHVPYLFHHDFLWGILLTALLGARIGGRRKGISDP